MIMRVLLRAVSVEALFTWYSYMAILGPMDRSYHELIRRMGALALSPSPPKSTSFHRGSFGSRLTKVSMSEGVPPIFSMMLLMGSVQMAVSIPDGAIVSGSRFQNRPSLIIAYRDRFGGNSGRYV